MDFRDEYASIIAETLLMGRRIWVGMVDIGFDFKYEHGAWINMAMTWAELCFTKNHPTETP